jgi:hypothetical protein
MTNAHPSAPAAASAFVVALAGAHPAAGCDPEMFTGSGAFYDTRISIKADCSFEDVYLGRSQGSANFTVDTRTGGPARDVGNGRIGQKIVSSLACGPNEMLLFVNCTTAEAVMIRGVGAPGDESGLGGAFIEFIQAPNGPIRLGPQSTVSEVAATARANDLYVVDDTTTFLAGNRKRDRYDGNCGCRLFYPDSVGAQTLKP